MSAGSRRDWKRPLRSVTCCAAMIACAGLSATGQQSDQLQEQLQQLQQQYETTTHDLEQRIASLQQQIEQEKEAREKEKAATVSAAALAEQAAQKAVLGESNQVGAKFQGQLASASIGVSRNGKPLAADVVVQSLDLLQSEAFETLLA